MKSENLSLLQKKLAEQIKTARLEKDITQEELALSANVDRTYVSQLERGIANPSLAILLRIATELDCQLELDLCKASLKQVSTN